MGFTVPSTLASAEDLATWTGASAPANADALLRSCTVLVLNATKAAYYEVDDAGLPTDAEVLAAMIDATCIQAASWAALGIDPLTGGVLVSRVKASKKIGTGSITYADTAEAAAARAHAYRNLVPEAAMRLAQQNLLSHFPGSS